MQAKTMLPAIALLLLGAAITSPAFAQDSQEEPELNVQDLQVVPMGAAGTGPSQITAEAIPEGPSNLLATTVSDDQINLTWTDNSSDEAEFRLELRTTSGTFQDAGTAIPANVTGAQVHGLAEATTYFFRLKARNASGDSAYSNTISATTATGDTTCITTDTAMCLNGDRFRVEASYRTGQGQSGTAHAVRLTSDTGYLWFFVDSNVEVVVKVLNGCGINNRYWVFAGGLTNVEVQLIVTDTQTGIQARYTNPINTAFRPIQDTSALASCP